MDENRTAFEDYMTGPEFGLPQDAIRRDPETGEYDDYQTQCYWVVWRAARTDVVVEMPVSYLTGSIGIATKQAFEKCRTAIHAAGIRTR